MLLLVLMRVLRDLTDQLACWTLAASIACMLAAIGHTTQASEEVCYPDHASPMPARPESAMIKATGRGLSVAGLLVSWIPALSGGPRGLLLWFHLASAATVAVHADLRKTLVLVSLAAAHTIASGMILGSFEMACALLAPLMLRGSQAGACEVDALWTSRAQHKLLAAAGGIASALCAGSFATFYSMKTGAPWTTLTACLLVMILGIRFLISHLLCVNSPTIPGQGDTCPVAAWPHAGVLGAWVCVATATLEQPHPRFLLALAIAAIHLYDLRAITLSTQPPAAASEACHPPPSDSPTA